MTDPDVRRLAIDIHAALVNAQRVAGDGPLSAALDMLAAGSGQNKFQYAASIIRGTRAGRPTIDDHAALKRIEAYPPAKRNHAVAIVARDVAGAGAAKTKLKSVERRLRRKLK